MTPIGHDALCLRLTGGQQGGTERRGSWGESAGLIRIQIYLMVVNVEHCQRRPAGLGGWRRAGPALLFVEGRVGLQGQLQVQDVVDDMLENLHFADFLILRNGGHQPLEPAVAVVHVVLQAEEVLLLHPAPGDVVALLGQTVQGELAAAGGGVLSNSFHRRQPAARRQEINKWITNNKSAAAGS